MRLDHQLIDIFQQPMPRPKAGKIDSSETLGLGVDLGLKKIAKWLER